MDESQTAMMAAKVSSMVTVCRAKEWAADRPNTDVFGLFVVVETTQNFR